MRLLAVGLFLLIYPSLNQVTLIGSPLLLWSLGKPRQFVGWGMVGRFWTAGDTGTLCLSVEDLISQGSMYHKGDQFYISPKIPF